MNLTSLTAINLAEVASEVVKVAYEGGLTLSMATMNVLIQRKIEFGNSMEILTMAQKVVDQNPQLAEAIDQHRRHKAMNSAQTGFVARTAQALQDIEDRAPVIEIWQQQQEEPPLPVTVLENGQHVFWDIVPTVLQRAGR